MLINPFKLSSSAFNRTCVAAGVEHYYEAAGAHEHVRRLEDLAHETVDHTWLWCLSPAHGRTLESDEFSEAVRVRLGTTLASVASAVLSPVFSVAPSPWNEPATSHLAQRTRLSYEICSSEANQRLMRSTCFAAQIMHGIGLKTPATSGRAATRNF